MPETQQQQKAPEKRADVKARQQAESEAVERHATSDLVSGEFVQQGLPAQMLPENQDAGVQYTLVGATGSNKGVNVPFGDQLPQATVPGASVPVAAPESDQVTSYPTGGHLPADTREATIVRNK
jgi:hypothetical protein